MAENGSFARGRKLRLKTEFLTKKFVDTLKSIICLASLQCQYIIGKRQPIIVLHHPLGCCLAQVVHLKNF